MIVLKPQPGPQEKFLSSSADITIYGGAAGGGKTYALLLEPLRYIDNPGFGAVIFRRQATQIMAEGGLFDNAVEMYTPIGATIKQTPQPTAIFPSGAKVSFRHLGSDKEVHAWQGSQICLICYDELTHFTEHQFFYMLSRNRSTCGVRPYIRATCNPDADSWVADFISWWIGPDGYAIKERSGKIRYFARIDGEIIWADTREELSDKFGNEAVKSVSFIASSIFDNKALLEINPDYIASLNALPMVERERLLKGNWKIRPAGGLYFKPEQTRIVKYDQKNLSLGGVKDLLEEFQVALSAVTEIPVTVLFGRSPGGLNSTGKADFESFYNLVQRIQRRTLRPQLSRLIDLIGKCKDYRIRLPETYTLAFEPLWSPTEKEQAETKNTLAQAEKNRADARIALTKAGALDVSELRDKLEEEGEYKLDRSLDKDAGGAAE